MFSTVQSCSELHAPQRQEACSVSLQSDRPESPCPCARHGPIDMDLRNDSMLALETKGLNIKKTLVLGPWQRLRVGRRLLWLDSFLSSKADSLHLLSCALQGHSCSRSGTRIVWLQALADVWLPGLHSRLTNNSGILE